MTAIPLNMGPAAKIIRSNSTDGESDTVLQGATVTALGITDSGFKVVLTAMHAFSGKTGVAEELGQFCCASSLGSFPVSERCLGVLGQHEYESSHYAVDIAALPLKGDWLAATTQPVNKWPVDQLHAFDFDNLHDTEVQKIGASTNLTHGRIFTPSYIYDDKIYIAVVSVSGLPFAEPGDSGALLR